MHEVLGRCAVCGGAARVSILDGYSAGRAVTRELCLGCADEPAASPARAREAGRTRLGVPVLLVLAGMLAGGASLLGDSLGAAVPAGHLGVGQSVILGAGALLVLIGALLRVDVIAVVGTAAFLLVLAADTLGVTGAPGFGWKQTVGTACAAGFILAAVIVHRLSMEPRAPRPRTTPAPA